MSQILTIWRFSVCGPSCNITTLPYISLSFHNYHYHYSHKKITFLLGLRDIASWLLYTEMYVIFNLYVFNYMCRCLWKCMLSLACMYLTIRAGALYVFNYTCLCCKINYYYIRKTGNVSSTKPNCCWKMDSAVHNYKFWWFTESIWQNKRNHCSNKVIDRSTIFRFQCLINCGDKNSWDSMFLPAWWGFKQ